MAWSEPALLGDIGATYARFALLLDKRIGPIVASNVSDFATPIDAIRAFLGSADVTTRPRCAAIAAAGPVTNERIFMTNAPWVVDAHEICEACDLRSATVVNDFAALAWSLPALTASDVRRVGGGVGLAGAPRAVIGPGTGFGAAGLVSAAGHEIAIVSEAGHATLPAETARDEAVIRGLRTRFGHASIERALSGPGLRALCDVVATLAGVVAPPGGPSDILSRALAGHCPSSVAALDTFCELLGSVAGDIALTLGARGGIYVAGGLVPRFVDYLERSRFRARFEAKGRMTAYLEAIPTAVIIHPYPAFAGLARVVEQQAG